MPVPNLRSDLIAATRALIDIPSVSRDEERVLEHLLTSLPEPWEVTFRGDAVAVVTHGPRNPDKPFVVIAGHTDTVPIADNVPSRQDGDVIAGRGACDMKGALAVMVETARAISDHLATGNELDLDVALLFFGREELPAADSALLPALEQCEALRTADFAVLMEPTSNALELGCQGNLNLTLTVTGEAAHTARPWTGSNAAHTAAEVILPLVNLEPNDVVIDGLTFREVANVTGIRGGVARNVIPDAVEIDINIRYAPSRSASEAEAMWVKKFSNNDHVLVEVYSNAPAAPVVREHALAQRLLRAGAGAPMPKQAWTNAADFALYNVPALNFGPGDPAFAHKDDEQISGEALQRSAEVLQAFLFAEELR